VLRCDFPATDHAVLKSEFRAPDLVQSDAGLPDLIVDGSKQRSAIVGSVISKVEMSF
jgi:hypothetical protein